MLSGSQGNEDQSDLRCSVCGRSTELFKLPGKSENYCLECSADVATLILLTTEIDEATITGQDAEDLVSEFAQLRDGMLERSHSNRRF